MQGDIEDDGGSLRLYTRPSDEVVLFRLHEGLYELSWDKPDIMASLAQPASEKVSPRAGLKSSKRCREVRGIGQKLLPVELLPHNYPAGSAECHEMKVVLPRSMPIECICMS